MEFDIGLVVFIAPAVWPTVCYFALADLSLRAKY
jgi:hypothetical protein